MHMQPEVCTHTRDRLEGSTKEMTFERVIKVSPFNSLNHPTQTQVRSLALGLTDLLCGYLWHVQGCLSPSAVEGHTESLLKLKPSRSSPLALPTLTFP